VEVDPVRTGENSPSSVNSLENLKKKLVQKERHLKKLKIWFGKKKRSNRFTRNTEIEEEIEAIELQ
jgi:TFIIF-interacting CTD phosphatase-like protein